MKSAFQNPDISIVIPVYNSEDILPELIKRIVEVFQSNDVGYEVILVNDFSTDNSWSKIQEIVQSHDRFSCINNPKNLGQAYASLKGIASAKGQFIVTIDDDLEYEPSDIMLLYQHLLMNQYDIVFGLGKDKYLKQGKSQYFANIRNRILNSIWCKPVTDSFKIFRRSIVFNQDRFLPKVHFEGFISQYVEKKRIGYLEVSFNHRYMGSSQYTPIKKFRLFVQMSMGFLFNK